MYWPVSSIPITSSGRHDLCVSQAWVYAIVKSKSFKLESSPIYSIAGTFEKEQAVSRKRCGRIAAIPRGLGAYVYCAQSPITLQVER